MRTNRRTQRAFLLGFLALAVAATPSLARAGALDDAKSTGHLGERYDGYLGVVKEGAAATALADDINAKRKAHYGQIAAKEGTNLSAVAGIAGAKLVENAPSGQYVMPAPDSGWKRVP